MEPQPPNMPRPEEEPGNQFPSPFKGRERLLTTAQLSQLRFNLAWSYLSTIGISSLTLKAVDTLSHSLMEGRIGTAVINTIAVVALGGVTAAIGRMAYVASSIYVHDIANRRRRS